MARSTRKGNGKPGSRKDKLKNAPKAYSVKPEEKKPGMVNPERLPSVVRGTGGKVAPKSSPPKSPTIAKLEEESTPVSEPGEFKFSPEFEEHVKSVEEQFKMSDEMVKKVFTDFKNFINGDYDIMIETRDADGNLVKTSFVNKAFQQSYDSISKLIDDVIASTEKKAKEGQAEGYTIIEAGKTEQEKLASETRIASLDAIDKWRDEIEKTGAEMYSVLEMASMVNKQTGENTIKSLKDTLTLFNTTLAETGKTVAQTMEESYDKAKQAMRMGNEKLYNDMTNNMAKSASLLGRAPTDPAFQKELLKDMQQLNTISELQIGAQEAQEKTAIAMQLGMNKADAEKTFGLQIAQSLQQTGLNELNILGQKLSAAERTGAGKEQTLQAKFGVEQQYGGTLQDISQQATSAKLGVQQATAGFLNDLYKGAGAEKIQTQKDLTNMALNMPYKNLEELGNVTNIPQNALQNIANYTATMTGLLGMPAMTEEELRARDAETVTSGSSKQG